MFCKKKEYRSIHLEYYRYNLKWKTLKVRELKQKEYQIPDEYNVVAELDKKYNKKIVLELVSELHPREQKVLSLRFGLETGDWMTLDETAKVLSNEYKCTREKIRQIEAKASEKIRQSSSAGKLWAIR